MTRRFFANLLAGSSAAVAKGQGFLSHRILRRPYREHAAIPAKPMMLYDALFMQADCKDPLRITAVQDGNPEPALQVTVTPRPRETFMLLGVHQLRAEQPLTITVESRKPFKLLTVDARFMHPAFRRVDGMVVYHDDFYKSHPETPGFGGGRPHHRVIFGPGADIGYGGGGRA